MKKITLACLIVTALTIGLSPTVAAEKYLWPCPQDESDAKLIRDLKEALSDVDHIVPNVPPEEEKYLRAEYDALIPSSFNEKTGKFKESELPQNVQLTRFAALESRPLYHPWLVRAQLRNVLDEISALEKPDPNPRYLDTDATQLLRAIRSASTLASFDTSIHNYVNAVAERRAPNPLGDKGEVTKLQGRPLGLFLGMQRFEECKLARVASRTGILAPRRELGSDDKSRRVTAGSDPVPNSLTAWDRSPSER